MHWLKESWLTWSYQTSRNVHFNIRHPVSNGIVTAVRQNVDIGWAEFRLGGLSLGLLLSFCYTNESSLLLIILQQITFIVESAEIFCEWLVMWNFRRMIVQTYHRKKTRSPSLRVTVLDDDGWAPNRCWKLEQ